MKQFDRAVLPLHAIACVTSIGVRITPPDRMAVHNSDLFRLQARSVYKELHADRETGC